MAKDTTVGCTVPAIDPQVALATSMHGIPGTYALLLGAGISIGAGTHWVGHRQGPGGADRGGAGTG